jgi:uncharacterized protein
MLVKKLIALVLLSIPVSARAEDVLIKTRDGATLSATVELPRDRDPEVRLPTILAMTIYSDPSRLAQEAGEYAARGFASVVADTRGKRLSPDAPVPYEHEARDAREVIDWIARQPWSNGKVGMVGGSYSGFTAWAATKYPHPALKGIAVSAAAIPGFGLPMHNNVFLNANYAWAFHVTNNKLVDDSVYADGARAWNVSREWFVSGRPYREYDAIDGKPNPWLQRWLQHPAYDAYWQSMVPYGKEFARIGIPALTITGYYDDGQISALRYLKEHVKHRRGAEHYLVIGPYDHFGTHARNKSANLRGYDIDAVAKVDSQELKIGFMDYVLRGGPKPELLRDRINYQVMGANRWRHVPTLAAMHPGTKRLYFSRDAREGVMSLNAAAPAADSFVKHEVDLANRIIYHNFHAYPSPIVQRTLTQITEAIFVSEPFAAGGVVSGEFTGELTVTINKKDFDLGVAVYEALADGSLFHLGYALQRASYVDDPTKRKLLTPGKPARIRFATSLVSKKLDPGSSLMVLVDANKNQQAQLNYGTGKDVSDETMKDAGDPLEIRILGGSYVDVPFDR